MFSLKRFAALTSHQRFFHICSSQRIAKKLPSCWDLATGKERWEACQHAKGNKDPWFMFPVMQGPSTIDCPNIVPSVFDKRLVICVCPPQGGLVRFYLHEGFPRRCCCNKWFVLERLPYPKVYDDIPDCVPE